MVTSLLGTVLSGVRAGRTPRRIAADAGLDEGLVLAAVDQLRRSGVVVDVGGACGAACGVTPGEVRPLACAGCVLAR